MNAKTNHTGCFVITILIFLQSVVAILAWYPLYYSNDYNNSNLDDATITIIVPSAACSTI